MVRIPSSVFSPGGSTPPPQAGPTPPPQARLKEEVFYHIHRMHRLPDVRRRRPSSVRQVSQPYYRNTGSNWPGFSQSDNFAVRWTGALTITKAGFYTVMTCSDDGSSMFIDNSRVVNNDGLHGWRCRSARKYMSAGKHAFKAEMFERGGGAGMEVKGQGPDTHNRMVRIPSSVFSPGGSTTPPPQAGPTPPPQAGLKEEVFYHIHGMRRLPDVRRRRPSSVRQVSQPYYRNTGSNWPGFSQRDNFAVRWTGALTIKKAGHYTVMTCSDDGSSMLIDNSRVVNNDGLHGWRCRSGRKYMSAGKHAFKAI